MNFVAFWLPTSINTAWLSVASSVAALVVPSAIGIHAGTELAAVSLAALVTAVGAVAVLREKDSVYGLVLIWSLAAVYGGQDAALVRVATLACIGVLLVVSLASLLQRKGPNQAGVQLNEEVRQALVPPGESPRKD